MRMRWRGDSRLSPGRTLPARPSADDDTVDALDRRFTANDDDDDDADAFIVGSRRWRALIVADRRIDAFEPVGAADRVRPDGKLVPFDDVLPMIRFGQKLIWQSEWTKKMIT